MSAKLPGSAEIKLSLDGSSLTASTTVNSTIDTTPVCETVSASIESNSTVAYGTKLTLSTATEGAEIYYTTDLSCPCVTDSASRIKYRGPITLTDDTTIIAYAVKDGCTSSATKLFIYNVTKSDRLLGDVDENGRVSIDDVTAIQKYLVQMNPDPFCIEAADYDKNGRISIMDATAIQRAIAK